MEELPGLDLKSDVMKGRKRCRILRSVKVSVLNGC
jgi:hypothetical protein